MKPPGDPDQQEAYALARRVLLDALDALGDQRDAVVLVGAQAIYLHTGDTDLAVAPFTTDGDIAINPEKLQVDPKLEEALHDAGFEKDAQNVGTWIASQPLRGTQVNVAIDRMVPEAVGGPGRRGARLGVHGKSAARKARGLEAALVDYQTRSIEALDDTDSRVLEVAVAGPSALLVAKLHKIAERIDSPDCSRNKDALDVYRLLQSISTETLADGIRRLLDDRVAARVTEEAVTILRTLFSEVGGGRVWIEYRASFLGGRLKSIEVEEVSDLPPPKRTETIGGREYPVHSSYPGVDIIMIKEETEIARDDAAIE